MSNVEQVMATGTKAYTLFQFIKQRTNNGAFNTTLAFLARLIFDSKDTALKDLKILEKYNLIKFSHLNHNYIKIQVN